MRDRYESGFLADAVNSLSNLYEPLFGFPCLVLGGARGRAGREAVSASNETNRAVVTQRLG